MKLYRHGLPPASFEDAVSQLQSHQHCQLNIEQESSKDFQAAQPNLSTCACRWTDQSRPPGRLSRDESGLINDFSPRSKFFLRILSLGSSLGPIFCIFEYAASCGHPRIRLPLTRPRWPDGLISLQMLHQLKFEWLGPPSPLKLLASSIVMTLLLTSHHTLIPPCRCQDRILTFFLCSSALFAAITDSSFIAYVLYILPWTAFLGCTLNEIHFQVLGLHGSDL